MRRSSCFIGHREIEESDELRRRIEMLVERLIVEQQVDTFLFGSKSQFNSLCYELVTKAKEKHPHIKRVYVRAEFPLINEEYRSYLLERYEDTYYPTRVTGAGKAVYVERNREMVDRSRFCVFYCKQDRLSESRKSGTAAAMAYAIKQNKTVISL